MCPYRHPGECRKARGGLESGSNFGSLWWVGRFSVMKSEVLEGYLTLISVIRDTFSEDPFLKDNRLALNRENMDSAWEVLQKSCGDGTSKIE